MRVDFHKAAIKFRFGIFETAAIGVRLASDGHQQLVELHIFLVAVGERDVEAHAIGILRMFSAFAPVSTRIPAFLKCLSSSLRSLRLPPEPRAGASPEP